jgi:hypothetical protein
VEQLQLAAQIGKQLLDENNELEFKLQEARTAEGEAIANLEMAAQFGKQLLEQNDELECALQASRKAERDALEKLDLHEKQTDALDPSSTAGKMRQLQHYNLKLEQENGSLSEKIQQQHDQLGLMELRHDRHADLAKQASQWKDEAEEYAKRCEVAKEEHEQDIADIKQLRLQLRDLMVDLKQWQDGGLGKDGVEKLRSEVKEGKLLLQAAESERKALQSELAEATGRSRKEEDGERAELADNLLAAEKKVEAAAEETAQLRVLLAEARSREGALAGQMKELKQQTELEVCDVDALQQQVFDAEMDQHIAVEKAVRQEREEAAVDIRERMEVELEVVRQEEREKEQERTKHAMEDVIDMSEIELAAAIQMKEDEQESAMLVKEKELSDAMEMKEAEKESAMQAKEAAHALAIKEMEEEHLLATAQALEEKEADAQLELERINQILVDKMEAKVARVAEAALELEKKATATAAEAQRLEAELQEARRREMQQALELQEAEARQAQLLKESVTSGELQQEEHRQAEEEAEKREALLLQEGMEGILEKKGHMVNSWKSRYVVWNPRKKSLVYYVDNPAKVVYAVLYCLQRCMV